MGIPSGILILIALMAFPGCAHQEFTWVNDDKDSSYFEGDSAACKEQIIQGWQDPTVNKRRVENVQDISLWLECMSEKGWRQEAKK